MNDDERLREAEDALRAALRVEPSPRLVERVRADAVSARPAFGAIWLVAAAVVLVVGSALVVSRERPLPEARPTPPAALAAAPPDGDRAAVDVAPAPHPRTTASVGEARPPEIIVAEGQLEALVQFAERAGSGQVPPLVSIALASEADDRSGLYEPLTVEPLVIAPLALTSPPDASPWARGGS